MTFHIGYSQNNIPDTVDVGPEQHLMSFEEGARELFGENLSFNTRTIVFSHSDLQALEQQLSTPMEDSIYTIQIVSQNEKVLGYLMVIDEYGKYRPISILVGVEPEMTVKGVRILVYRENRGGEVQRIRFLSQYRKKSTDDPIRINQDIINITGATISVRGVNRGVRRALHILEKVYGNNE